MRSIVTLTLSILTACLAHAQAPKFANLSLSIGHKADSVRTSNVSLGLIGNVERMHGLQVNVVNGVARREMRGVQLAGVSNIVRTGNGLQLAGMANASVTPFRGVQLAGITNVSMGMKRGVQLAGAANVCAASMRGVQAAPYNYADTLSGSQLGLINVCVSHPRGVQVGLINYSRDTVAHKIGLVNVNPRTRIDLMLYGGSSTKTNVALRFRNRSTYSIIGVGTHYFGLDERFSGALFYRIGQYFPISPRVSLSGDVGFFHVESFEENSTRKPDRLYSLQARLNADWQAGRLTSVFASVGYGDTRHYHHSTRYRQRLIVEAGLAFRLARSNQQTSRTRP